jgi:hypothetical protein
MFRKKTALDRDYFAYWGRGLTIIVVLLVPFMSVFEPLKLSSIPFNIPAISLLCLVITILAGCRIIYKKVSLPKISLYLFVLIAIVTFISSLGIQLRGGNTLLGLSRIWSMLLLASSISIHYFDDNMERIGVIVAGLFSVTIAALLGIGELLDFSFANSVSQLFSPTNSSWFFIKTGSGPFSNSEVLGWFTTIFLPLTAVAALSLKGKQRDIACLTIAVLWAGLIASFSLNAPIAALVGLLYVMVAKGIKSKSYVGISLALALVTLVAVIHPGIRARWSADNYPVNINLQGVTKVEGFLADSLIINVLNPGPLSWSEDSIIGYHLLFTDIDNNIGEPRMMRGGWIGQKLESPIISGESIDIKLPFEAQIEQGFFAVDIKKGDHFLAAQKGVPYLLYYQAGSSNRINTILQINNEDYLRSANIALTRGGSADQDVSLGQAWRDARTLVDARPLFGLGARATEEMLGHSAMSLYIDVLVSYGWFGLLLLAIISAILLFGLILRSSSETIAYTGVFISASIYGISTSLHSDFSVAVISAILIGLAWASAYGKASA